MKLPFFNNQSVPQQSGALLQTFIDLRRELAKLPPLSEVAQAEFDQGVDLEHLYYSSKIEGTTLTSAQIKRAVHEDAV